MYEYMPCTTTTLLALYKTYTRYIKLVSKQFNNVYVSFLLIPLNSAHPANIPSSEVRSRAKRLDK